MAKIKETDQDSLNELRQIDEQQLFHNNRKKQQANKRRR